MLNVFLGFACNLNCSYCLQAGEDERTGSPKLNLEVFKNNVIPIAKAHNIKRIAYWGGEPILYWRHIKEAHEALLDAGLEFEFVKITTNGTLWEKEHVEDANRWDAFVNISRHKAFGTPKWDVTRDIKNQSYSHVVTAREYILWDFLKDVADLEQRYGRRVFPWINWVHATKGCPTSEYLTFDMAKEHSDHLMELAKRLVDTNDKHIGSLFVGHMKKWRANMERKLYLPMCFGNHQIDIDLHGNRYGCHHNVNKHTKVGTYGAELDASPALDHIHRFVNTDECKTCPIRFWCRGNCHMSQTHEVDCYLSKRKHEIFTFLEENWKTQDQWDTSYSFV
jgi:radical SAM protein with 4Fe4S-binding SPASM domain